MYAEKVFWEDPYLTCLEAKVTSVNGQEVAVDRTIAYAFAGGQESDRGTIGGYAITQAIKQGKQIVYIVEAHDLHIGDNVIIKIDWDRRYKIMKLQFTAEIILELITQHLNNPDKIGAHIAEDKARVDFAWQGNITETFTFLEKEAMRLMKQICRLQVPSVIRIMRSDSGKLIISLKYLVEVHI